MRSRSIYAKLASIVIVFVLGFSVHSLIFHNTTPETYETSDYREVMRLKDVIADISPPSLFVLEAPFVAVEMARTMDPDRLNELMERWGALQRHYQSRLAYWGEQLPQGALRTAVLETTRRSAERVFAIGNEQLLPALRADDGARIQSALNDMYAAYHEHEKTVVDAVALARTQTDKNIAEAAATIRARKLGLFGLGMLIVLAGSLTAAWIGGSIVRRVRAIADTLDRVADGDLRARAQVDATDELGSMAGALNSALDAIEGTLVDVRQIAMLLADNATGVARNSDKLSGGAQQQAANLEQTAASLEEITATIKQSASSAQEADQVAASSHSVAERGGRVVTEAIHAMNGISDSSRRIADIITTIDEIALQTNLLALNASVEAARAGEQGRGFAVVAGEVGNLAQRSAAAAKEVKSLIHDSLERIRSGHALVGESGKALSDIILAVKQVSHLVTEIAAGSREQSIGVDQVNQAVAQMDQITQGSAGQTDALAHTAAQLAESAAQLKGLMLRFQLRSERDQRLPPPLRAANENGEPPLSLAAGDD